MFSVIKEKTENKDFWKMKHHLPELEGKRNLPGNNIATFGIKKTKSYISWIFKSQFLSYTKLVYVELKHLNLTNAMHGFCKRHHIICFSYFRSISNYFLTIVLFYKKTLIVAKKASVTLNKF